MILKCVGRQVFMKIMSVSYAHITLNVVGMKKEIKENDYANKS